MHLELGHIFAGEAFGAGKKQDDAVVDDFAIRRTDFSKLRPPLDKAKIVSWNIICSIALYDLRTDKP
jgi:hypothetical protein